MISHIEKFYLMIFFRYSHDYPILVIDTTSIVSREMISKRVSSQKWGKRIFGKRPENIRNEHLYIFSEISIVGPKCIRWFNEPDHI